MRGLLINEIATLGSEIIYTKERLSSLRSRRWSKQFKKQHEESLALISRLETTLALAEGRRRGLMFFKKEFHDL